MSSVWVGKENERDGSVSGKVVGRPFGRKELKRRALCLEVEGKRVGTMRLVKWVGSEQIVQSLIDWLSSVLSIILRVESYTHSVLQARNPGIIHPKHFLLVHTLPYAVLATSVDFIL